VTDFINDLGATLAWLATAVALMGVGFGVVDLLTPGRLSQQVSANLNAGLLVGAKLLAVGIIVFSAIWTAPDSLDEGLLEAVLYSALGLLISAGVFMLLDFALPVRLRHLVNEERFDPTTCVAVGAEIGLALVVAAAIS
jgi:uncharacterized membrane protein YjfL (UPF0719 family)